MEPVLVGLHSPVSMKNVIKQDKIYPCRNKTAAMVPRSPLAKSGCLTLCSLQANGLEKSSRSGEFVADVVSSISSVNFDGGNNFGSSDRTKAAASAT